MKKYLKVALVHEYLTRLGGAERVLKHLLEIYPKADIFTLLYNREKVSEAFPANKVKSSFINNYPNWLKSRVKFLAPLFPSAIESLNFTPYDLIISSSNSFAKGIITKPKAIHISYCHAPATFLWNAFYSYRKQQRKGKFGNFMILLITHYLRQWDRQAADRVDYFIANSKLTQARIKKYYRKDSVVIYPPVDVDRLKVTKDHKNYFLIVSQLTQYKNIDIAIEAFNKLALPLVIIGAGPEQRRLKKLAGSNIELKGFLDDDTTIQYYQNCRAFIFAGSDDFGIAPVEAMAAGKPVLALRDGGALETIIEGKTGEFFDSPSIELLADGIRRLTETSYDSKYIRKHAEQFSTKKFITEIESYINKIMDKNNNEK
ncbi:MAG: glycosyltransferase [Candidatus Paceibacterota bacterium]